MTNNHMGLLSATLGREQARFIHLVGLEPLMPLILSHFQKVRQHLLKIGEAAALVVQWPFR
jgi:hypothetical protein